jgi:uncharacterized membrane protein YdjX (TVP38/TMEM64 family)
MTELVQAIGYWVHDLGAWGYPLAVALMAAVAVLPIPAEIPAVMNGMLFGPVVGSLITWTGAVIGAQLSFELSRRFGRPLVERLLPNSALARVDGAVRAGSWPALLVARLIPAIAFTALNWGIGLTLCRRRTFFWTTAVGIVPGTILFVSSGEGLARLYARHPILAVALVVLAVATMFLVAWYRRAKVNTPPVLKAAAGEGASYDPQA